MEYIEVETARGMSGLRLACTHGIYNLLGEAAKVIFTLKCVPFTAVAQYAGEPNATLQEWTGYRNAPVAVWNDEAAQGRCR